MAIAKSPAPQSKASVALVKVDTSIKEVDTLIGQVRPPIQQLLVQVTSLDTKYLTPGIKLCNDIVSVCNSLKNILDFCGKMSGIPIIGTIVGRVASVIEKMNIEGNVKRIVGEVQQALEKIKREGLGRITNASNTISSRLQQVSDKLPSWQQTLDMMLKIFGLIDLGVYIFFDKDNKDPSIDTAFSSLQKMATDVGGNIDPVLVSLRSLKSSVDGPIQQFKDAIAGPLRDGFGDFPRKIGDLRNSIDPLANTLQDVLNHLGPIRALLTKAKWLVDLTIGRLVGLVIDNTPLRGLIDEVSRKIESALGVDELRKKVKEQLETSIASLQTSLDSLVNQTQTITTSVNTFDGELTNFRQHPVGTLSAVVVKGLKVKYPQLFQQGAIQHPKSRVAFMQIAPEPPSMISAAVEVDAGAEAPIVPEDDDDFEPISVPERLRLLDDFVKNADDFSIPEAQIPSGTNETTLSIAPEGQVDALVTEDSNNEPNGQNIDQAAIELTSGEPVVEEDALILAPKLDYGFYDGASISVLIRIVQDSVLQDQADARSEELAPMSSIFAVQLAGGNTTSPTHRMMARRAAESVSSLSPAGGKAPKLDEFAKKCAALSTTIAKAKAYLGRISTAAQQADADFASFAPESIDFSGHLTTLLQQIDPLFTGSINLLELPLKYRTALTQDVGEFLHAAGASPAALDFFPALFASLDKADHVIKAVRERLGKIMEQSKTMSASYKTFFAHAKEICYPEKFFPKATGTNLATFIAALQGRLDGAAAGLATLVMINETFAQHPEKITDPTNTFAKLDALYGKLLPIVDATATQAEQLSPLVDALYTALSDAHSDVQVFFKATKTVNDLCLAAESQVVSADSFRGLCRRINNTVAPFEGMLAELQVQKDSLTLPEPKIEPANVKDVVKAANDALEGKPMEIFTSFLSSSLSAAVGALVEQFIGVGNLEAQLMKLGTSLSARMTAHIDSFAAAINNLGTALDPKAGGAATSVSVLLDDASAKSLAGIVGEINAVVASATGGTKP